jgi:hypothetical protein
VASPQNRPSELRARSASGFASSASSKNSYRPREQLRVFEPVRVAPGPRDPAWKTVEIPETPGIESGQFVAGAESPCIIYQKHRLDCWKFFLERIEGVIVSAAVLFEACKIFFQASTQRCNVKRHAAAVADEKGVQFLVAAMNKAGDYFRALVPGGKFGICQSPGNVSRRNNRSRTRSKASDRRVRPRKARRLPYEQGFRSLHFFRGVQHFLDSYPF